MLESENGYRGWEHVQRDLDPAWGRVKIQFSYDAWDWINFSEAIRVDVVE